MRTKEYKIIGSDNDELNKIQQYVNAVVKPLMDSPIVDGIILKNIQLESGSNYIDHKLNRPLQGYIVVGKRANISIWDNQYLNSSPSKNLLLEASGAVIIDLYVF